MVAPLLLLSALFLQNPPSPADAYAPLRLYDGLWLAHGGKAGMPAKDTRIENQCRQVGIYYACQQTVGGKVGSLIVFLPYGGAGHYYTQGILNEGHATGRGELEIRGGDWTYSSQASDHGVTTYYRTTNHFSDPRHIHYELAESKDGKSWTITASGDEAHQ